MQRSLYVISSFSAALGFSEPFLSGSISLPHLYFSPRSYVAPFVIDTKGFGKYLLDFVGQQISSRCEMLEQSSVM